MKRYWIASALVIPVGLLLYFWHERAVDASLTDDFATWPPSPAAILASVGPVPAHPGKEDIHDARHKQFAALFQKRYRDHTPAVAVGLHFLSPHMIKLLTPARMETYNIDRIAVSAWHESKVAFGHEFDIDIYETFLSLAPVKIGTLRPTPNKADLASINYDYPALNRTRSLPRGTVLDSRSTND
ncbi:MAG TPA: hypothetical protein VFA07_13350 [Chthonomonadaceae bacterium]|nr:hypothetical protein [Chthonomonadaceae bacterium]